MQPFSREGNIPVIDCHLKSVRSGQIFSTATCPHPLTVAVLVTICLLLNSCGFGRLTDISNQDTSAPTAAECGACHIDQYNEWRQTAHAQAYISPAYKQQSDQYRNSDCLFCHIPGAIVGNGKREVRSYNLSEGITCVSCHLHQQAMLGPNTSEAPITPHPVRQDPLLNSRLNSSQLCGTCHQRPFAQWQERAAINDKTPTCQQCHSSAVKRPHTRGTNVFTRTLVALEPVNKVRSHSLILSNPELPRSTPELLLREVTADAITVTLRNTLPHDVPTATSGERQLIITLNWSATENRETESERFLILSPVAPGEELTISSRCPEEAGMRELTVALHHFHRPGGTVTLIVERRFSVPIP